MSLTKCVLCGSIWGKGQRIRDRVVGCTNCLPKYSISEIEKGLPFKEKRR